MKSKHLLMMLLLALGVPIAMNGQAPSPVVPYLEDFESYNVAATPANWNVTTNGSVNGNVSYGVNTTNGLNGTKSFRMVTPAVTSQQDDVYVIAKLPVFDYQAGFLKVSFYSKFTSTGNGNNTSVKLQVGYVLNNEFVQIGGNVPTSSSYGTEHVYSFNATSVPSNARIAFRQVSQSGAHYPGTWDIDNVNVTFDTKTPTNLTASNITNTSAYLSWDIQGNYSYFEVEYADNSNFTSATNEPTNNKYFTLSNLASGTTYYVRVRAKYIDSNTSYFTYGDWATTSFTTTCDAPTGLSILPEDINETNIFVTWDDNLIDNVELEYKQSSQSVWLPLATVLNSNVYYMSVSGLNLQAGTLYQVRAKFPCSDWCQPVEFRTAFGGRDQLFYAFEDGMPADFTVSGPGAANVSVSTEQSFGADPHSLKYNYVSGNPAPAAPTITYVEIGTYLRTYQFNSFLVYFDMYCGDINGYDGVQLQYDAWVNSGVGTWQNMWRPAATWLVNYNEQGWVERYSTITLPSELQGGVSKLRFRLAFLDYGGGMSTYVDNFNIFPKGGCDNVNTSSSFVFTNYTTTSISFQWDDPNYDATTSPVAHSSCFEIRYRNETIPTNTNTGWIIEYVWVDNSNPTSQYNYTLTNLDPSSYYLISFRTLCPDGGYTEWSRPSLTISTLCQAYSLSDLHPFTEDFDGIERNPACWTYTTNWSLIYAGYGGHNWCLRSNYNPVAGWNDYIDTPEIELDGNKVRSGVNYLVLRFWAKCSGVDGTGNKVKVLVGNQETEIFEMPSSGCDEWQQIHLSLSRWLPATTAITNTISVRFDHGSNATAEWFIDDVVITSWDEANYGNKVFDDAPGGDHDWTNDNNWYPEGAPTNSSSSWNVTLMSTAWVPANSTTTVGTMRFGTQGYLDVKPGSNLTITTVDIPENKVFVEPGATLNIGTAHFSFDKVFHQVQEGIYNITNLNNNDHWLSFNYGTTILGTVTLTSPGKITVLNTWNATTVNSSGQFEVYPDANVTIGTLNAAEVSPLGFLIQGTANITTLNASGETAVFVQDGGVLNATTIVNTNHNALVIEDGGQVKSANSFNGIIRKNITGYGAGNESLRSNWYLIASPIAATVNTTLVPEISDELDFDMVDFYMFDQSQTLEWDNVKCDVVGGCASPYDTYPYGSIYAGQMVNTQEGYLYACQGDYTASFSTGVTGNAFPATNVDIASRNGLLGYSAGADFAGWNLIGNPYTCDAYLKQGSNYLSFYRMNAAGDRIVLADNNNGGNKLKPCEGVFVEVAPNNEQITFTTTAPSRGNSLDFTVSKQSQTRSGESVMADRARIAIGEGRDLGHLDVMADPNRLYIPMKGKEMAMVYSQPVGELPLNFEAAENGTFTLSFENATEGLMYCHLIDNKTGVETDLLQQPEYTFDASVKDYPSRFRVVFASLSGDADGDDETFAFNHNGNWIILNEGRATLQVVDLMGRILSSEQIEGSASKVIHAAPGVYMIRLVNGENVRVQKIVVR